MNTHRHFRSHLVAHGGAALALLAGLSACSNDAAATAKARDPFVIEKGAGTAPPLLRLEPRAVERLALRTEPAGGAFTDAGIDYAGTVPYTGLLYQPDGQTFVYTNPEPLVFVRASVTVLDIVADVVRLSAGPAAGTPIVTAGAAELMGVEFGVGK